MVKVNIKNLNLQGSLRGCHLFSVCFWGLNSMSDQVFLYLPLKVLDKDSILNNGRKFPKVTFGVNHFEGFETIYDAVDIALETGYRSFDCSPSTESHLGFALEELLAKHNLRRQDITISSKILPRDYGIDNTTEAFWRSCENLKTNYIDLFLMQWPGNLCMLPEEEEDTTCLRAETWKEIVKLNSEGVIRSPGVCHFNCKHLEAIRKSSGVIPAVNQVEFHPKCPQIELLEYCRENNMLLRAISFKDTFHPLILNDGDVKNVAKYVGKSPTRVLLKWTINKGVAVIIESENPRKIRQNFELFDFVLEKPEMDLLTSISAREKYFKSSITVA